jgi:hypothetical protein
LFLITYMAETLVLLSLVLLLLLLRLLLNWQHPTRWCCCCCCWCTWKSSNCMDMYSTQSNWQNIPRHIPNATRSRIECAVTIHALAINPIAWTCTAHIQIDNHTPPWARVYAAISENTSNWTVALLRRTYFSLDSAYLLPNAGNLDCNTVTAHSSKIFQGRLTKQQALMNTDCYQHPHADYSLQTE